MAILTYPLNGILYDAEDTEIYNCTRTSGVFSDDGHFPASVTGTRQITIGPGLAWMQNEEFHGKAVYNPENVALTIAEADAYQPRIDRIVLQFDKLLNQTTLTVKQGEPSSSPVAPEIERDSYIYELGLYTVRVNASSVSVSDSNISNTFLDDSVCGIMADAVTQIPTQELYDQWYAWFAELQADTETLEAQFNVWFEQIQEEAETYMNETKSEFEVWMNGEKVSFEEWFDTVQDTLDSDTAGKLTNLVNDAQDTADEALEQIITGMARGFLTDEVEGGQYALQPDDNDDSYGITVSRAICNCDDIENTSDLISDEFQENYTYKEGDYCIYQNQLFRFTADKEAGPWDWYCVKATQVGTELAKLGDGIRYVGKLSTSVDMDNLFETGIYEGANGDVPKNAPDSTPTNSTLIAYVYNENSLGTDFTVQEFTYVSSSVLHKFIRRYTAKATPQWNDWNEYVLASNALTASSFSIQSFTSDSVSIDSGNVQSIAVDVSRSGYTPIAAWQRNSSQGRLTEHGIYLNGNTVTINAVNLWSSTATGTYSIQVLYVANDTTTSTTALSEPGPEIIEEVE